MAKLVAILNVVAWSGFWAFGYVALFGGLNSPVQIFIAAVLAVAGAAAGAWAYLWLVRHVDMAPGRPVRMPAEAD